MVSQVNPYAVTAYNDLERNEQLFEPARTGFTDWIARLSVPLLVIGSVFAVYDIESILVSGPTMFVTGAILLTVSIAKRQKTFLWFWILCLCFPVIIFLIIFLGQLSPRDAQMPIGTLICCVSAISIILLLMSIHQRRQTITASEPLAD